VEKIKKFVYYYRYAWKLFLLDMVCATGIAGLSLTFPIMTRQFMKEFIPNKQIDLMIRWSIALVGLYLVRLVLQYVVNYWGHVVGVRMEFAMRRDLFNHLQTLDCSFYDDTPVGYLMSRIVNDLRDVSELAHHGPEDIFLATLMLIGSFSYLIRINAQLTLIVFAFVPVFAWFALTRRRKMNAAFCREREEIGLINADLENSLSGIREVKSFTNEEFEKTRFLAANESFRLARERAFQRMAEYSSGLDFISNMFNIVVLGAGGLYVNYGIIDLADLTAYLMFVNYFLQPIRQLTNFVQQYELGMTGFERFVNLMAVKPSIVDRPGAIVPSRVEGRIEIQNVSFEYEDGEEVLRNISLTIHPGETVALVGSSGGGKTTLARLLLRFYDVTSGRILLDGTDIRDIQLQALRQSIGLVQQDVFLFSGTIRENIIYGRPDATEEEMMEAARKASIDEFIESLPNGYDTHVGEHGVKLSGGQKQRISIARIFLKNPPILILDEATSALDNVTERQIQRSLEKLSEGRTTLVISHRLSTIRNADRIIVIEDGRVEEMGTHEELLEKGGIYAGLHRSQLVTA